MTTLTTRSLIHGGAGCRLTSWLAFSDPQVALYLAREAVDAVTLDVQHGQFAYRDVLNCIAHVSLAGKPTIVRVPVGDFQMATRFLDAGASAIIAPMVDDATEARRLVDFVKYGPVGQRSWGPFLACAVQGRQTDEYLANANRECLAIPMIETAKGLENLEAILSVDGIDGVFVGPADLSLSLSGGRNLDPLREDVIAAQDEVLRSCRALGKQAWVMAISPENAASLRDRGFDLVALGMEVFHLQLGTRTWVEAARHAAAPKTPTYA